MLHHGANEARTAAATGAESGTLGNQGPATEQQPQQLSSIDPAELKAAQVGEQGSVREAAALGSQGHAELPLNITADVPGTFKAQTTDGAEWSDSMRLAISARCLLAVLSIAQPGICYTQVPPPAGCPHHHPWYCTKCLAALCARSEAENFKDGQDVEAYSNVHGHGGTLLCSGTSPACLACELYVTLES